MTNILKYAPKNATYLLKYQIFAKRRPFEFLNQVNRVNSRISWTLGSKKNNNYKNLLLTGYECKPVISRGKKTFQMQPLVSARCVYMCVIKAVVTTLQIICTFWEHAKPVSHFVPVPCMFIEQLLVVTAKTCLFHYTWINACCGNMHLPVLLIF